MKIESIIKREGGTVVEMDAPKRQYHFKPEEGQSHEAPHVAIVGEQVHARALLRIREGFRLVEGEQGFDPESNADGFLGAGQTLTGSNVHNATYPIAGDETILLGDLVVMAFQDSGLTYEAWEDLADQERYEYIDATLHELQAGEGDPDAEELNNQQQTQTQAPAPTTPVEQKPEETPPAPPAPETPPAPAAAEQTQTNAPAPEVKQENAEPEVKQENPPAQEAKPADEAPLEERPRKELVALYKARFGREPSTRMNIPDIAAALNEDDD